MNEPALESKEIQITRTTNGPSCTKTRKCKTYRGKNDVKLSINNVHDGLSSRTLSPDFPCLLGSASSTMRFSCDKLSKMPVFSALLAQHALLLYSTKDTIDFQLSN